MRRSIGLIIGSAAGVAIVAVSLSVAVARNPPYSVTAGGTGPGASVAFTGQSIGSLPRIVFTDTTSNTTITCDTGTLTGNTTTGSGLSGVNIAQINGGTTTFTNCNGPGGLSFTVTGSMAWQLQAMSGNGTSVTGRVTNVHISFNAGGSACSFALSAKMPFKYIDNYLGPSGPALLFTGNPAPPLVVSNVSGCFGLINNNDQATDKATYRILTTQKGQNPLRLTQP